jgi:predicted PurR-regulated permease PerM
MATLSSARRGQNALILLTGTVVGAAAIAALYWAQSVLIPVALAVFFAFILTPPVLALQRRGLGRGPSVAVVVLLAVLLLFGVAWLVAAQASSVLAELPAYADNLRAKVESFRRLLHGPSAEGLKRLSQEVLGPDADGGIIVKQAPSWAAQLTSVGRPALEVLTQTGLALVLLIFMLHRREDLRDRFLRLASQGRVTRTTKAVDDASGRISRFLMTQLLINATLGLTLALGLWLIGLKHALLWGLLAAVLRYVPYVGIWFAAVFPIAISLALFEGWAQPLLVVGLYVVLEVVTSSLVEPSLFGQSIGVSEVALLVAAAFWAFLWGPVGLVLSAPLTVCLVVLGRHVPQLRFFDVLLGDEPPLSPQVVFYQRLLVGDQDEAEELIRRRLEEAGPERAFDELLLPALVAVRHDRRNDTVTEEDRRTMLTEAREILDHLGERLEAPPATPRGTRVRLLALPAHDEADALALEALRQVLDAARWEVEVASVDLLASEAVGATQGGAPAVVCIAALPPGGLSHTRYLCKRLRARFPDVKIAVGRWGGPGDAEREQLRQDGADLVGTSLRETRAQLKEWLPVLEQPSQRREAAPREAIHAG